MAGECLSHWYKYSMVSLLSIYNNSSHWIIVLLKNSLSFENEKALTADQKALDLHILALRILQMLKPQDLHV